MRSTTWLYWIVPAVVAFAISWLVDTDWLRFVLLFVAMAVVVAGLGFYEQQRRRHAQGR
jgi:hypothetical protein